MASSVQEEVVIAAEECIDELDTLQINDSITDIESLAIPTSNNNEITCNKTKKLTYVPCTNEDESGDQFTLPKQTVWKQPVVLSNENLKETEWPTPSTESDASETQKTLPVITKKVKAKQVWLKMDIKEEPREMNSKIRQKYPGSVTNQNGFRRGSGRGRGSSRLPASILNGSSAADPRLSSITPLVPRTSAAPLLSQEVTPVPSSSNLSNPRLLLTKSTSPSTVSIAPAIVSDSEPVTSSIASSSSFTVSKSESESLEKLVEERTVTSHRSGAGANTTHNNGHLMNSWRQHDTSQLELGPISRAKRLEAKGRQKYVSPYNGTGGHVNWGHSGHEDGYTVPYMNQDRDHRPQHLFMQPATFSPMITPLIPPPPMTPLSPHSHKSGESHIASMSPPLSDSGMTGQYQVQREQVPLLEIEKLIHPDGINHTTPVQINEGVLPDKRLFTKFRHGMGIIFATRRDYVLHFLEYYFSKENLTNDAYMRNFLIDGACPITNLLEFPKLHKMSVDDDDVRLAVRDTHLHIVNVPNGVLAVGRKDGWVPDPLPLGIPAMLPSPQQAPLMRPGAPLLQNIYPAGFQLMSPNIMVPLPHQSPTDGAFFIPANSGYAQIPQPFRFPPAQAWLPPAPAYHPQQYMTRPRHRFTR